MDTRSSIAIVPLASLDVDIRAARAMGHPSVRRMVRRGHVPRARLLGPLLPSPVGRGGARRVVRICHGRARKRRYGR